MKKFIYLLLIVFLIVGESFSQEICGTPVPASPPVFQKAKQDSINAVLAINTPYCVPVYITVFADDNGTNRAASDEDIQRNFEDMVAQFSSHNICFMLIDILQVNSSDLNSHNASTEEAELNPYRVEKSLNVFLHRTLVSSNGGLNGTAYAIPNTYLSLVGSTVASTTNITTFAHETGHCFGLVHTFEDFYGIENVTRNSANACYDCDVDGDLICDTPADDPTSPNSNVNSSCVYTAGRNDPCGVAYAPATNNIMGYGNRACRMIFTSGQGARMRSQLVGNATISGLVAQDNLYRPTGSNATIIYSTGKWVQVARDNLYTANYSNDSYSVSGSARVFIQSKKVRLKPGTHFSPNASGRVNVKANPFCN